jgi:uncharacterized phage-like protein YoqJ
MRDQTAAFTGYRPHRFTFKGDEKHPDCVELKSVLREQIELLYEQGVLRFLTGACIGVDTWAGEIVLDLMKQHKDIELHCIVPFEEQAVKWTEAQRERYYNLLRDCTKIVQLSVHYYEGCYRVRNQYLVANSKYLLAVYDQNSKMIGGTGQTVNMALKNGNSIICIHPQTRAISTEIDFKKGDEKHILWRK